MLRSLNLWKGLPLRSLDGEAGTVESFLVDDEKWVVRYLVLNTGDGLAGKRVLISPVAIDRDEAPGADFRVRVTQEQLERCPDFDLDEPVTRDRERGYLRFFAWPLYWGGGYSGFWGGGMYPGMLPAVPAASDPTPGLGIDPAPGDEAVDEEAERRSHLNTTDSYLGYRVRAQDGTEVGEVDDFLVDDRTWALGYVAVHSGGWLGGKRYLVPLEAFDAGSWASGEAHLALAPETLRSAPEWQPLEPVTDAYEAALHAHYGIPRYAADRYPGREEAEETEEAPAGVP